jgi:hypothetical protein
MGVKRRVVMGCSSRNGVVSTLTRQSRNQGTRSMALRVVVVVVVRNPITITITTTTTTTTTNDDNDNDEFCDGLFKTFGVRD